MSTKPRRFTAVCMSTGIALTVWGGMAGAQQKPGSARLSFPQSAESQVTFACANISLDQALGMVFRAAGKDIQYRAVGSAISFLSKPITTKLTAQKLGVALANILYQAQPGLTYTIRNDIYIISYDAKKKGVKPPPLEARSEPPPPTIRDLHETPTDASLPDTKVSVRISQQTARDALLQLVQAAKVDYAIAVLPTDNKKVTLNVKDVPLETALQTVLAQVNQSEEALDWFWRGNMLGVGLHRHRMLLLPADTGSRLPVAFRARNEGMQDALYTLLRVTGVNYTLDPIMRDRKITVEKQDGPLLDVLHAALKAAPTKFAATYEDHIVNVAPETATNKKERKGGSN